MFFFCICITVLYQKRYKRERRLRGRLQQQMENEFKKRNQIEDILKASGAPAEALRILAGNFWWIILHIWRKNKMRILLFFSYSKWMLTIIWILIMTIHAPDISNDFLPRSLWNSLLYILYLFERRRWRCECERRKKGLKIILIFDTFIKCFSLQFFDGYLLKVLIALNIQENKHCSFLLLEMSLKETPEISQ